VTRHTATVTIQATRESGTAVFSYTVTTVAALEPEQALALLAALQPRLTGAAVLDARGTLLAGDAGLDDTALAVRSGTHTVLAAAGAGTLRGLLELDLEAVLAALDGRA